MEQDNKEHKHGPDCSHGGKTPWFGYILIVLGVIFILEKALNTSILGKLPWDYIWPLLIILLGIHFVANKTKQ